MAMGMPRDEYWNGDPDAVRAYRKADRIRQDRMNQQLWLQGMYIYEALCDVAPILHAFGKKGTKPHPFSTQPYDLHPDETARRERRRQDKQRQAKGLAFMHRFMSAFNNSKQAGGEPNAKP